MSEEIKTRGRQKGVSYKKPTGYIMINENLRVEVDTDCLTLSETIGKDKEDKSVWGNNKNFTSWDGVLSYLIKKFTTERLSKKATWSFMDARQEIVSAIKDVKSTLLGEINKQISSAKEDIKNNISKFNRNV
jgi:hypothetical protein